MDVNEDHQGCHENHRSTAEPTEHQGRLYDLDESAPPILANKNRLEQVIFNLVTNARDAIENQEPFFKKDKEENIIVISTWSEQRDPFEHDHIGYGYGNTGKECTEDI